MIFSFVKKIFFFNFFQLFIKFLIIKKIYQKKNFHFFKFFFFKKFSKKIFEKKDFLDFLFFYIFRNVISNQKKVEKKFF